MTFKALKFCCNGDGKPVQPPSKVLCADCLAKLSQKFEDLRKLFEPARPSEREPQ
jgi:hypothetical protein